RDAPDHVGQRQVLDAEGGLELGLGLRREGGSHSYRTDWRESAMRLTAMPVVAIARAGNRVGHQMPAIMFAYSWLTDRPQSGEGGWTPTPRNDRVATVKIAYPKRTVSS